MRARSILNGAILGYQTKNWLELLKITVILSNLRWRIDSLSWLVQMTQEEFCRYLLALNIGIRLELVRTMLRVEVHRQVAALILHIWHSHRVDTLSVSAR